jgi:hypothetical protein
MVRETPATTAIAVRASKTPLHLYTILKNLHLQQYIRTGTTYMTCGTKNA